MTITPQRIPEAIAAVQSWLAEFDAVNHVFALMPQTRQRAFRWISPLACYGSRPNSWLAVELPVGTSQVHVPTREDLMIMKTLANRPRDRQDRHPGAGALTA